MTSFEKYKVVLKITVTGSQLLLKVIPQAPIQSLTLVNTIRIFKGVPPGFHSGQGFESNQNVATVFLTANTFYDARSEIENNDLVVYFSEPAVGAGLERIHSFSF